MRVPKGFAENEELIEEDVRKVEVDIREQKPSRAAGAAMQNSTTRRGAAVGSG